MIICVSYIHTHMKMAVILFKGLFLIGIEILYWKCYKMHKTMSSLKSNVKFEVYLDPLISDNWI